MTNPTKPNLKVIEKAIIERDQKDAEIDKANRTNLVSSGLQIIKPKKIIKINTGDIIGVPNVVEIINNEIKSDDKIIMIEGESGCGKSSTVKELARFYKTNVLSASDIFRYLTYVKINDNSKKIEDIIACLDYKTSQNGVFLYQGDVNISKELHGELHSHEIDLKVADIASISQPQVIAFLNDQINLLALHEDKKIILEGRAFTLDFLPCDLRVILCADIKVRAERRMKQER